MSEQNKIIEKISIVTESLPNQLVNISEVHLNVSQEVIITTDDKVRLCLTEHLKRMEKKNVWMTPAGVFVAIVTTLVTSTFKDIGFDAATWRAIFIIVGVVSFVWFLWTIKEAWQSENIEDVVARLKKDQKK